MRDAMPAPAIAARKLSFAYKTSAGLFARRWVPAVRGVDVTLPKGQVMAIVGESGCGKSTLARLLLGLLPPTEGDIAINGADPRRMSRRALARLIQPVFQDPSAALNPRMRVTSIIGLPLKVHRIGTARERAQRVTEMMERVGLPPPLGSRYPWQLSGGQRQRVAIARALVLQPIALVCDEPTSALDISVQAQILNLLHDLRAGSALSLIFISHNLAVVENIADRVAVMYLGRVVEEGPAIETLRRPRHPYTEKMRRSILSPRPGETPLPEEADDGIADSQATHCGCAYAPRCASASAQCWDSDPVLRPYDTSAGPGAVACHHPLMPEQEIAAQ